MRRQRVSKTTRVRNGTRVSVAHHRHSSSALSSITSPVFSGSRSYSSQESGARALYMPGNIKSGQHATASRRSLSPNHSSNHDQIPSRLTSSQSMTSSQRIPQQFHRHPLRAQQQHQQQRSHSTLSQHVDTPYNNENTPFDFTEENMKKIQYVLKKYPSNYKQSAVKFALTLAQEQNDNWLPLSAMNKVAQILDMPPIKVYEVASFYTMFNRDKVGKYHISVCGTTTCMTMGAEAIKKAAMEKAGVTKEGQISKCGNFSIKEVECTGACTNAPMVQVNYHEYYENLTPDTMRKVMDDLVEGKAKPGPQNGQSVAEGPLGQTTLVNFTDRFPQFRDLDALLAERGVSTAETPVPVPPAASTPPPAASAATTTTTTTTAASSTKAESTTTTKVSNSSPTSSKPVDSPQAASSAASKDDGSQPTVESDLKQSQKTKHGVDTPTASAHTAAAHESQQKQEEPPATSKPTKAKRASTRGKAQAVDAADQDGAQSGAQDASQEDLLTTPAPKKTAAKSTKTTTKKVTKSGDTTVDPIEAKSPKPRARRSTKASATSETTENTAGKTSKATAAALAAAALLGDSMVENAQDIAKEVIRKKAAKDAAIAAEEAKTPKPQPQLQHQLSPKTAKVKTRLQLKEPANDKM